MSSVQRTVWWRDKFSWRDKLVRETASVAVAIALVGASLGAIGVSKGVPLWLMTLMAALVFAGGSEFLAVGLMASGAAPVTAVLSGLMLNARHFPFGLAVGDLVGRGRVARAVGSHLMVDESVAFGMAQEADDERRRAYWVTGIALYCTWAPSVFVGGLIGMGIADPTTFGLDAALPAALLALIIPSLRDRQALRAVVLGALVAVVTTPFLPAGLPVMFALVGVAAALPLPNRKTPQEAAR